MDFCSDFNRQLIILGKAIFVYIVCSSMSFTCMDTRTTVAPSGVLGVPGVLHRQLDVALDVVPVRVGSVSVVSLNCEVARSDCICTCGGIIL